MACLQRAATYTEPFPQSLLRRMTPDGRSDTPLTLDNCDREPIHIPGAIQPHGALLAFGRDGCLRYASANACALLGPLPAFGQPLAASHLQGQAEVHALIADLLAAAPGEEAGPLGLEAQIGEQLFDVVAHADADAVLCEFERRSPEADQLAGFAQKAYRSMNDIKRQRAIGPLLEAAVEQVRAMTGFDRVMAYRFRHDDSGDIVAESRREDLEPYLGRRYPASDIPAQARRLYIQNTLRLIADVGYEPVPLLAAAGWTKPLDLSQSVLRSVSPIHIEYLRNMGVGASMSVSIVVGGRLWGMIACHHMGPRQVPYSVRLAADVIAQLLAATVQTVEARQREATLARAAQLQAELATRITQGDDLLAVAREHADGLADALQAPALVMSLGSQLATHGGVEREWAKLLLARLAAQGEDVVHVHRRDAWPEVLGDASVKPPWCGLLALRYDAPRQGWLVALRPEQIETIRWGGKPDKHIVPGPLGPRLTPRGSFDEWRETVRDTAEPWSSVELDLAERLRDALARAHATRSLELDSLRSQLWAVLGHDLRTPLQSLITAEKLLDRENAADRMRQIIKQSTGRMQHLVRDLLDVSRLQNGLGLGLRLEQVDLVQLVNQLVEEAETAHPGSIVQRRLPEALLAKVDAGRFAQVIANLLSNARHHGKPGSIEIEALVGADGSVVLAVINEAEPIPEEKVATLFDPFKQQSVGNPENPTGMGLGLYIADQIVRGHGGVLGYRAGAGKVRFELVVPVVNSP